MNQALQDYAFLQGHDIIKERSLPKFAGIAENAVIAGGWNMIAYEPTKQLERFLPIADQMIKDEILKFAGESAIALLYRWMTGKERSLGNIMLKQMLAQGSQMVVNKL